MAELIMTEEGSTPSTPATNKWKVYFKSDGLYIIDDTGAESGPFVTEESIHAATSKATPVDNDELGLLDSAASYVLKKLTWANLKATLATIPYDGWIPSTATWSYSSADSPTFVISINADMTAKLQAGMRIKLTQTTAKYFIVTAVGSFSGGATLVTVYGGTDYTLADASITSPYYSPVKAPFGFPLNPEKWTVSVDNTTTYTKTSPVAGTWYNTMDSGSLPNIVIPIGAWDAYYEAAIYVTRASSTSANMFITLANATATESDAKWTGFVGIGGASGTLIPQTQVGKRSSVVIATKTTMYLNIKTNTGGDNINVAGATTTTKLRAICAYL